MQKKVMSRTLKCLVGLCASWSIGLGPLTLGPLTLGRLTLGDDSKNVKAQAAPAVRQPVRAKGDYTFDDLKFEIEKGGKFERSMLTKSIEQLDKKPMRIRGYILPTSVYKQTGISEFVLVRDNMECCFGPGAAIYDCIIVQMEKGVTATFTTRPVAVKGKFAIEEFKYPDGTHYAIYKLTATEVK